jgi:hypothetical protein
MKFLSNTLAAKARSVHWPEGTAGKYLPNRQGTSLMMPTGIENGGVLFRAPLPLTTLTGLNFQGMEAA